MNKIIECLVGANFNNIDGRSAVDCGFYISFVDSDHRVVTVRYPHFDYLQTEISNYVRVLQDAGFVISETAIFKGMGKIAIVR